MTQTQELVRPAASLLPGARVVARIRRLLILACVAGLAYAIFTTASHGTCVGGYDEAGRAVDASGAPAGAAPLCIQLTMHPSPLIFIAVGVIILWALGRVLKKQTEDAAIRVLDRAAAVVGILFAVSIVVAQVWFSMIPIQDWNPSGSNTLFFPFPFGSVEMQTAPMPDTVS